MAEPDGGAWDADEPTGSTPLDDDERSGLRLAYIATRGELNEAEQENILSARIALRRRRLSLYTVLDDQFVRDLHKLMFSQVWTWAGAYRSSDKSIGIAHEDVGVHVRMVMDDARAWVDASPRFFSDDDLAVRIHHRLVSVHPFPNGNGRHAREFADLLLAQLGRQAFTWGRASLTVDSTTRNSYIQALRSADNGDYEPLNAFVRS